MQTYVHRKKKTANEKDPSTALGMTIREQGFLHIPFQPTAGVSLRPFGAPPSGGRREYAAFPPTPLFPI